MKEIQEKNQKKLEKELREKEIEKMEKEREKRRIELERERDTREKREKSYVDRTRTKYLDYQRGSIYVK